MAPVVSVQELWGHVNKSRDNPSAFTFICPFKNNDLKINYIYRSINVDKRCCLLENVLDIVILQLYKLLIILCQLKSNKGTGKRRRKRERKKRKTGRKRKPSHHKKLAASILPPHPESLPSCFYNNQVRVRQVFSAIWLCIISIQ